MLTVISLTIKLSRNIDYKTAFVQSAKFYKAGEFSLSEQKLGTHAHKKSATSTVSAIVLQKPSTCSKCGHL